MRRRHLILFGGLLTVDRTEKVGWLPAAEGSLLGARREVLNFGLRWKMMERSPVRHVCSYVCIYINICLYIYIYLIYVYKHIRVYVYTHTPTYDVLSKGPGRSGRKSGDFHGKKSGAETARFITPL